MYLFITTQIERRKDIIDAFNIFVDNLIVDLHVSIFNNTLTQPCLSVTLTLSCSFHINLNQNF